MDSTQDQLERVGDKFTFVFLCCPGRIAEIAHALTSIKKLKDKPKNIFCILNPIRCDDDANIIHSIFKTEKLAVTQQVWITTQFIPLAHLWNNAIIKSDTEYVCILNDDIEFDSEDVLNLVYKKHLEGYKMVQMTESWSAMSIHKSLIAEMGWFDERYPYSFEDVDAQIRMMQLGLQEYKFNPYLVKHNHSPVGRRMDLWHASSKFFYEKWDMCSQLGISNPDDRERWLILLSGKFDTVDRKTLKQLIPNEDKYPEIRERYRNQQYN